ncbi:hypothetical protein [Actinomadura algeriensis]|uniref:Nuclear transport factor 2 family protein n=1 Tax=Actinomadura algeriensis TaxID=1679523 RepID=A0ABR9JT10_9ACTN|nr:hypothetical protein [Actinomadura algeriensis]MBE1533705.1 hypothetical protein [Actinomadura algeriensis]
MRLLVRAVLAVAVAAACLPASSSAVRLGTPRMDHETTEQLTFVARTLLRQRSQALVQTRDRDRSRLPEEILGVRISPRVARAHARTVRELENRNRAPVEGGPAYTGAKTTLEEIEAVRHGDVVTLEAVEHTVVKYDTGKVRQDVRRRFEFKDIDGRLTLVGEQVLDPGAHPVNDPVGAAR